MIQRDQLNQLKKKDKIQIKNCGATTKNFVVQELSQKNWFKLKSSLILYRLLEQNYYFNLLTTLARKSNLPSILSLQDISIHVRNDQIKETQKQIIYFQIERPYLDLSLREMLQQRYTDELYSLIPQLFYLFLQSSEYEQSMCLLNIPANFLIKRQWNKKFMIFNNYTSCVGLEFIIEKQEILTSKFYEMACYLHPATYNYQKKQFNVTFQTKIYSLTMLILSILLKKQLQMSLQLNFQINSVCIKDIRKKWQFIYSNMINLLENKTIKDQISQKLKRHKQFSSLKKFLKKVYKKFSNKQKLQKQCQPYFQCWKDVFQVLNPTFLVKYMKKQTKHSVEQIKKSFKLQDKNKLQFYKKLGIIHPKKVAIEEDYDIALYYMLKLGDFQSLRNLFKPSSQIIQFGLQNNLDKFIKLHQIREDNKTKQDEILSNHYDKNDKIQQETQKHFSIEEQIKESLFFNVTQFQLSLSQKEKKSQGYAPNQFQKSLDIYGAYLWL